MKTIFVPKTNLSGYVEYPTPSDLENYYSVKVTDDFSIKDKVFSVAENAFVEQKSE